MTVTSLQLFFLYCVFMLANIACAIVFLESVQKSWNWSKYFWALSLEHHPSTHPLLRASSFGLQDLGTFLMEGQAFNSLSLSSIACQFLVSHERCFLLAWGAVMNRSAFSLLQATPFLSPEAGSMPLDNSVADHSLCPFSNRILVIQTLAISAQQGDWEEWAPYTSFNHENLWGLLSLHVYVGTSAFPVSAHSIEICQLIFLSQSWEKGKLFVCCTTQLLCFLGSY